jgi:hypothetical protein
MCISGCRDFADPRMASKQHAFDRSCTPQLPGEKPDGEQAIQTILGVSSGATRACFVIGLSCYASSMAGVLQLDGMGRIHQSLSP